MQTLFPEGYVFTRVLHGLAWTSVASVPELPPAVRGEALAAAERARQDLAGPYATSPFPASLTPSHGAFYTGWTLWLDVHLAALHPEDPERLRQLHTRADGLADALDRSLDDTGSPFLESYHGAAWPADAVVGVAALSLHDRLFASRYEAVVTRWRAAVAERLEGGLIPHAASVPLGDPREGVRGSSQALMLPFLAEIDSARGAEMYRQFRDRFVTTRFGLAVVTEYPDGVSGEPDIDSGPLPLGVSLPATVVAIAAARAYGDHELARSLGQTVEAFGLPVEVHGRRSYAFGAMPVGDAFLAWARTVPAQSQPHWPTRRTSRLPVSLVLLVFIGVGGWYGLRPRKPAPPEP